MSYRGWKPGLHAIQASTLSTQLHPQPMALTGSTFTSWEKPTLTPEFTYWNSFQLLSGIGTLLPGALHRLLWQDNSVRQNHTLSLSDMFVVPTCQTGGRAPPLYHSGTLVAPAWDTFSLPKGCTPSDGLVIFSQVSRNNQEQP